MAFPTDDRLAALLKAAEPYATAAAIGAAHLKVIHEALAELAQHLPADTRAVMEVTALQLSAAEGLALMERALPHVMSALASDEPAGRA
jgi:pheromone shutdown protein TraB